MDPVASPTPAALSAVHCASPDEMYAVGPDKQMLAGSRSGWTHLLEGPAPMFGVAKFQGAVWVGASTAGLLKLDGATLAPLKPNIKAEMLDARGHLLISTPGMLAESPDGAKFAGRPIDNAAASLAKLPPAWTP